jgi:hypothetical protein
MSSFVPTTLIIYIENGEIKTRIERQLTSGRKTSRHLPTSRNSNRGNLSGTLGKIKEELS